MNIWDIYQSRITAHGDSKRNVVLLREQRDLSKNLKDSLSFQKVKIDGLETDASIINSDNLNEKKICSMPGESFECGSVVEWANNHWLITEKDANDEVYTKGKLLQCNYLLRWIDDEDVIHKQWCIIEDGTKYLTGEFEDKTFVVTRGDSRISMTIGKNKDTAKFNRKSRFLIDDQDSGDMLAYLLTKPLKVGKTYGGKGVYSFVLQEVVSTNDDNMELGIADYYKHFPKQEDRNIGTTNPPTTGSENDGATSTGKKVWL